MSFCYEPGSVLGMWVDLGSEKKNPTKIPALMTDQWGFMEKLKRNKVRPNILWWTSDCLVWLITYLIVYKPDYKTIKASIRCPLLSLSLKTFDGHYGMRPLWDVNWNGRGGDGEQMRKRMKIIKGMGSSMKWDGFLHELDCTRLYYLFP